MTQKKVVITSNLIIFSMLFILGIISWPVASITAAKINSDVIYNGDRTTNSVSLMINIYWGTEFVEDILKCFDDYDFKTTFFVGGMWVEDNVELLNKIIDRGHEIGNHGFHHKDHDKLSYEQNKSQIAMTHKLVKSVSGYDMNLFAPPSGAYDDETVNIAKTLGYKTIMWTRDTIDWRDKNATLVFNRAIKNIKGGDLILMHPTKHTLDALPNILLYIKNAQLSAVTVSTCLNAEI